MGHLPGRAVTVSLPRRKSILVRCIRPYGRRLRHRGRIPLWIRFGRGPLSGVSLLVRHASFGVAWLSSHMHSPLHIAVDSGRPLVARAGGRPRSPRCPQGACATSRCTTCFAHWPSRVGLSRNRFSRAEFCVHLSSCFVQPGISPTTTRFSAVYDWETRLTCCKLSCI